jgi:hypothetical protein
LFDALIAILLLLGLARTQDVSAPVPKVTPLFLSREIEGGPAFLIECRNVTDAPLSSGSLTWALTRSAIRIDGNVLDEQGGIGPGLTTDIPSGGTWRGIIELRQSAPRTSYAVTLGANVRMPTVVPLAAGRHTIAVRCSSVWSDEVPFYWEQ